MDTYPVHHIIYCSSVYSKEQVIQACTTFLRLHDGEALLRRLAVMILLQYKEDAVDFLTTESLYQSHEDTCIKLIMKSYHEVYENDGSLMMSLLNFHQNFFYKIGGRFPGLFFRAVRSIYLECKKDVTKREIEQTVRIILFDQPQYSLYAVDFLNSFSLNKYNPHLLEVSWIVYNARAMCMYVQCTLYIVQCILYNV